MFLLPTVLSTLTAVSAMPKEVDLVPTETFVTENVKTVYAGNESDDEKEDNPNTKKPEANPKQNTDEKPVEEQKQEETKPEENIDTLKQQLDDATRQVNELTTKLENEKQNVNNLNNEKNELTTQLADANRQVTDLTNEKNELTTQLADANRQVTDLTKDKNNLTKEKDNLTKDKNNLTKDKNNLTNEKNDLTTQLNKEKQKVTNLTNEKNALDDKKKKLEQNQNLILEKNEQLETDNTRLESESYVKAIKDDNKEIEEKLNEESKKIKEWSDDLTDACKRTNDKEKRKWFKEFRSFDHDTVQAQRDHAQRELKCLELCTKDCDKDEVVVSLENSIKIMEKKGYKRQAEFLEKSKESAKKNCINETKLLVDALGCNCADTIDETTQKNGVDHWNDYAEKYHYTLDDIPGSLNTGNDDEEINSVTNSFSLLKAETKPANNKFNMVRNVKKFFITNLVGMNFLRKM